MPKHEHPIFHQNGGKIGLFYDELNIYQYFGSIYSVLMPNFGQLQLFVKNNDRTIRLKSIFCQKH